MKIIIIEDELLTAKDLMRSLHSIDEDIEIVKHCFSVKESIEYLSQNIDIDLIFSDIKLEDGDSFEIFNNVDILVPVIFCTAYDEYALNAFHSNGIDYILKPFTHDTIKSALEKYRNLTFRRSKSIDIKSLVDVMMNRNRTEIKSLLVHHRDKIIPIKFIDIPLFYVEDKYTFAHTNAGKRYIVTHSLEELSHMFGNDFFRVNRQFIVQRNSIKEVLHLPNRKLKIILTIDTNHEILVGKLKITSFLKWLKS